MPLTLPNIEKNYSQLKACGEDLEWDDWSRSNFVQPLPGKFNLSFAVTDKNKIIGYSIISQRDKITAHLHRFMVSGSYRRQGVGKTMWEEIFRRLRQESITNLTLKVSKVNLRAIKFYKKKNAKIIDEDSVHYIMRGKI